MKLLKRMFRKLLDRIAPEPTMRHWSFGDEDMSVKRLIE